MNQIILIISTFFYVGKIPKAPGTFGSLAAFIPWYFIKDLPPFQYLAVIAVTFVIGFLAAGTAEKLLDKPDAGPIVIDEVLGMFIALFLVPQHPVALLAAFLLFRFFDILKPFPVNWFDQRLHGGLGIMLDDVAAGLYSLIILQAGYYLFF